MKVLNKNITCSFLAAPENYAEVRKQWSERIEDKETNEQLSAESHLLYLVLMGKDWTKSFTAGTSIDFDNGGVYGCGPYLAMKRLMLSLSNSYIREKFLSTVTDTSLLSEDAAIRVLQYLPTLEDIKNAVDGNLPLPEYRGQCTFGKERQSFADRIFQGIVNTLGKYFHD